MPKLIMLTLIASDDRRGAGVEGDPIRLVECYHLPNGKWIAEYDSYADKSCGTINFFEQLRRLKQEHHQ